MADKNPLGPIGLNLPKDEEENPHAGCLQAWVREVQGRRFAEARLAVLLSNMRTLAHQMDGLAGSGPYAELGGKTVGGAIRAMVEGSLEVES